ncbi:MAG: ATPase, T2SS/T4P/T4SS family [Candidatus Micrarchaeia archaeon]
MLGWRILGHGEYLLDLPTLSGEEESLIRSTEERFREACRLAEPKDEAERERLIGGLLAKIALEKGLYLDRAQQGYLGRLAYSHIYGFAFLGPLLDDQGIEEISVIGPSKPVYVFMRKKGWLSVNACFDSEKAIGDMANRMARALGRRITIQNPRLDAMLPDGSRLHASISPVSCGEITIRKFRNVPFSPRELWENGTAAPDAIALLALVMQCDMSVILCGNTASGKTSTLNALFSFVPSNERVVIAEETPEISIPHPHQLRLVSNRDMGIRLRDLVYDSLRMRPDRMIVGEVRDAPETEALFDVLLAGQARGSYATFHAQSACEGLSRLVSLGARREDLPSIDCLVVQRRMLAYDPARKATAEVRRIVEIAEVDGSGAQTIYRHGKAVRPLRMIRKISESSGLSAKEVMQELSKRRELVEDSPAAFGDFFASVQGRLYGGHQQESRGKDGGIVW